jgi:hypothetical protein
MWNIPTGLDRDGAKSGTMAYPNDTELTVAKGKAPGGKSEYEMTWAVLRRQNDAPLSSQYLCVLEPYEKRHLVQKIEPVNLSDHGGDDFPSLALRVTTDEYIDTIILQNSSGSLCQTADGLVCDGEFGFWRERNGKPISTILVRGTTLRKGDTKLSQRQAAYEGIIASCDFAAFEIRVTPEPRNVEILVGKHLRIHNNAGNNASYLIKKARCVDGEGIITLDLDPRIGEGFIEAFEDNCLVSRTNLRLARFGYYAGKTLANENKTVFFRLHDVAGGFSCYIDAGTHGNIRASELFAEFGGKEGGGLSKFIIYDYGPGDSVIVNNIASLE